MKITQSLRAEVLPMEEAGVGLAEAEPTSRAEAAAEARTGAKSTEFLAEGGKLCVEAAE